MSKPLQQAFQRFEQLAGLGAHSEPTERDRMLLALLKWTVSINGAATERAGAALRNFRESHQFGSCALWEYMDECEPLPPAGCGECFSHMPASERMGTVLGLVELSMAAGCYDETHRAGFRELATGLKLPEGEFTVGEHKLAEAELRRARLMRSGAGLAVALVVLLVFILTATWLRSVIFGLILAYICLPVEKVIERMLVRKVSFDPARIQPAGRRMTDEVVGRIKRFVGNDDGQPGAEDTPEKLHHDNLVKRASTATVVLVTLFLFLCVVLIGSWGAGYLSSLGHSVRGWIDKPDTAAVQVSGAAYYADDSVADAQVALPPKSETPEFVARMGAELNKLKIKFKNIPLVNRGIDEIGRILRDPDAQRDFLGALFKKSGGILQFSLGALGMLAAVLLDILLTVFFFSLFLRTLALKTDGRGRGQSLSTYCVNTVFNGHWLPVADDGTMKEAERVVDGVVFRLKVWLRGYIILITIDFVVYTTFFTLLGVPYAPILGFIAGCGLLLPYIGPIASALLTILVTLALGGDTISGWQIAGIAAVYLVENGIIEQFFLYPAVIGEALGLSTLETIIVVLLGGMLAGVTGMIFALPTAAVIKFIVPQLYRTVGR